MFTFPRSAYRRRRPLAALLAALSVALVAAAAQAEEVQIEHDGLTLNADLSLAPGKTVADGVILMTHATLQHNRMEIIRVITRLFNERGYSTLAMTHSAGIDDRRGPYDCAVPHRHTLEGHMTEIGLWIGWLKDHGARRILLAGHSAGANRIAQFMSGPADPAISRVVLFAPSTAEDKGRGYEGYWARYRKNVNVILDRARALVAAGRGDALMEDVDIMFCARTQVSARTFVSIYDPAHRDRNLLPNLLSRVSRPTLVIGASEDNITPDMTRTVAPFVDGKMLRMVVIEGCGHFFRDLCADDAVDAAVKFLEDQDS